MVKKNFSPSDYYIDAIYSFSQLNFYAITKYITKISLVYFGWPYTTQPLDFYLSFC